MAKLNEPKVPAHVTGAAPRSDRRMPDSGAVASTSAVGSDSRLKGGSDGGKGPAPVEFARGQVWGQVQKLALYQLDRLVALESKVLRDDSAKPVHDLRVASRRLQSLLDFLYASPRPAQIQKLRRRLQRARRVLGDLRNQDVMAARTGRILARKRATHREAWEAVQDYILGARPKIAARAYRKLTRLNLADVYIRLREQLAGEEESAADSLRVITFPEKEGREGLSLMPVETQSPGEPQVEKAPAERFAERLGDLWRDFEGLSGDSRRDPGTLHALRIAAKRLRYTIEVASDLEVSGSAETLDWLRQLQGKLGDWHDAEVLGQTMINMVARRKFLEEHLALAIEIEKLVLRLRSSKAHNCQAYFRGTFRSAEYRRTAEWIAQWTAFRRRAAG